MIRFAFDRYAPFIQEYIYKKNWADLRQVQVEACEAILDTKNHVIIASGTASGKTEAAFFPILTALHQEPSNSIGVVYIGPLKALINDQFERLSELLEDSYIPVYPWHGDISQSMKKKALRESQGILQITPESLESLIMNRPGDAYKLFCDLKFIVIDEIHALMGTDRGLQVICLLTRLERITKCKPKRIGLSATLNDYIPAMSFLSAGSENPAMAVGVQVQKRTISLGVESFIMPENEDEIEIIKTNYTHFIYKKCYNKKCLIFTNSRSGAEKIIMDMKRIASDKKEKDIFFVHHGSVSASLRHEAEKALRDNQGPTVTAATLTLELGIDIGNLDSTIQIGAPYTCSSFVQRLGRSGRRTGKPQMMFVNIYEQKKLQNPFDAIPWILLRSIAIIQLYLEERWVEPFQLKPKPFSILVHQTLSTLITLGELSPSSLAKEVLTLPAFRDTITQDEYRELLQYLLENDFLQRMDSGGIIVGIKGEKLTSHFSFYAVFQAEKVYHVHSRECEIGTLDSCPALEEVFILAGRTWKVQSLDENRKIIYVESVKNNRIPSWNGSGGHIHTKVVSRMKQVLEEDIEYSYLQDGALKLLKSAREYVREVDLLKGNVIACEDKSFLITPWVGTKELQTIKNLLSNGLKNDYKICSVSGGMHYIKVFTDLNITQFLGRLKTLKVNFDEPDLVIPLDFNPQIDKYDTMIPSQLLRKAFLYNEMNVKSAVEILLQIKL